MKHEGLPCFSVEWCLLCSIRILCPASSPSSGHMTNVPPVELRSVDSHTRGICGHAQPPKIGFNVRSLPGDHSFRVAFWLLGENGMILHVCRIPALREVIRKTRELFGHIDRMGYETEMTNYWLKVGIFWVIFSKTKNWVKIFTNRFVHAALINPSFFFFWRLLL